MQAQDIQTLIQQALPDARITVEGNDGRHFNALIVSESFTGLNAVKRQQRVYAALGDVFENGTLHALSLKTLTPDEWRAQTGS